MRVKTLLILTAVFLQACTNRFVHEEYPLKSDMVPSFKVNGQLTIDNAQSSSDPVVVHSFAGVDWTSDLHTLTDGVVQQAIEELNKHGQVVTAAKPKSIGLKVLSLESDNRVVVFHSIMHMEAVLGDGEVVELANEHTTGWTWMQDLNGCMAEGVMTLFTNEKVLAYLAQ